MWTPRRPWEGRAVVLGVTGGIAAYKAVQLARDLTLLGARVDTVLTGGALEFVRPLSFEAVTGRPALTDLFSAAGAAAHIRLGREADAVVVAPATADFMARAAHGHADDLLTTTLLATRAPVLLCPAMNDRMFSHPQTRANLEHLRDRLGYAVAGPATGALAWGEGEGPGRMLEPADIVDHVGRLLGRDPSFEGRRVLVTSGPTREPLDPVRFLSNRSSGRMGHAVARAAWRRGAEVVLVTGPVSIGRPAGIELVEVETASEMRDRVVERMADVDVAVFAAAVADYRPAEPSATKLHRADEGPATTVGLSVNPDVAREAASARREGAVLVGFALDTGDDLVERARRKQEEKELDLVVANEAGREDAGFDAETNRVTFLHRGGEAEGLPLLPKDEVAEELLDRVAVLLGERG